MSAPGERQFHRPRPLSGEALDNFAREDLDPAVVSQVAHETAAALVKTSRAAQDPELTARLVGLVDELGLDTMAQLWAAQPARSLPGALWRLYALKEWIRRSPHSAAEEYREGMRFADVAAAVAGVAEPPGPDELGDMIDAILRGVFTGDLALALNRAGAFARVVAAGRAADAQGGEDQASSSSHAKRAAAMLGTGEDLDACARLWRREQLV